MGYEKQQDAGKIVDHVSVVEATDDTGRLIDRTAFETTAEADRHAAEMRAKGYKVEQSSMDPKPKEDLSPPRSATPRPPDV